MADGKRLHKLSRKQDLSAPDADKEPDKNKDSDKKPGSEKHIAIASHRHRYGEYRNVLLTDGEFVRLKAEIPGWEKMVVRLSCYMKSTGKA